MVSKSKLVEKGGWKENNTEIEQNPRKSSIACSKKSPARPLSHTYRVTYYDAISAFRDVQIRPDTGDGIVLFSNSEAV